MAVKTIVVLEGDEAGQERLEEPRRVRAPDVIGLEFRFPRCDLSLESRRATENRIVYEAAAAVRDAGLGLKAATITPEGAGDVGSPNRILREEIGGGAVLRTRPRDSRRRPPRRAGAPLSVVRAGVGDAERGEGMRAGGGGAGAGIPADGGGGTDR